MEAAPRTFNEVWLLGDGIAICISKLKHHLAVGF